jgi:hypothetical protein
MGVGCWEKEESYARTLALSQREREKLASPSG